MGQRAKEIIPITIEQELKQSYLDYAMSVIVGRALPDVRDGLKPVHRRVLFAMSELNNDWNKPYKKSARVVGDVIGKYHPHGDSAVYDTIVRMAQPFSLRYMLVDGQGNFGSVDGDAPAAMRYTEVRMARISHSLLADLEKETVDFAPNYDGTEMVPEVLPTRVPNLLVNGSSGIAVGMATNIPPHNLTEVIDATIALIHNPELSIRDLMEYVPGPDFPTAGIINGRQGIAAAYLTGRGKIYVRAKADIETHNDRSTIIVTELPYQVNKARLLEKIAELVKEKRLEGISALRDESDKDGMRMVIELKRGEQAEVILNNLYSLTQMQSVFGINMVALDGGQPRLLDLKQLLQAFVQHRREVVTRRSIYDLRKARMRAHILEGWTIALSNIDEMIALIKAAKSPADAKVALLDRTWAAGKVTELLARSDAELTKPEDLDAQYCLQGDQYRLTPEQAQAILELRLHRLTGLEQDKIHGEYNDILDRIKDLIHILSDPDYLHEIICNELNEVKDQFADERRTVISDNALELTHEDLIQEEDRVVTFSHLGYAKSQSLDSYRAQKRGGKGKVATTVKDEDFVKMMLVANTHDNILCFSSIGKVYWMKVYQVPLAGRNARGKPIVNLLPLSADEAITAILPIKTFDADHYIVMATMQGKIKKVALTEFSRPRTNGKIATDLNEGDRLVGVAVTDGQQDIMLMTNAGKAIRFAEADVRPMGRTAAGVRGIKLKNDQRVISLIIPDDEQTILSATQNGYGQRTAVSDYRPIGRGGQGVIAIQATDRNGEVVASVQVSSNDDVLMITDKGTMVRTPTEGISVIGRNTQGMRLIRLADDEKLVAIECIVDDGEDEEGGE